MSRSCLIDQTAAGYGSCFLQLAVTKPSIWIPCVLLLADPATGVAAGQGVLVYQRDQVQGGDHWRLRTVRGTVHVWRPSGHEPRTCGAVVYVHGHGSSADRSWKRSRLATQFEQSGRNALFVVPDAPAAKGEWARWPSINQLLEAVAARTGLRRSTGAVVVVAHSSGFRTAASWILDGRVHEIILLDGFHGGRDKFDAWLRRRPDNRLTLVAARSSVLADAWLRRLPRIQVRRRARVPSADDLTTEELSASVLYLRSQFDHERMVRCGQVLPLLLNQTRLGPSLW